MSIKIKLFFSFLTFLFIGGCSVLVSEVPFEGSASIQTEKYQETLNCLGRGLVIKGVKKLWGKLINIEGTEIYLRKGTYLIYYWFKEQRVNPSYKNEYQGEVQPSPCTATTIAISKDEEKESLKGIHLNNWGKVKIKVNEGEKYYLYIQDGEVHVQPS